MYLIKTIPYIFFVMSIFITPFLSFYFLIIFPIILLLLKSPVLAIILTVLFDAFFLNSGLAFYHYLLFWVLILIPFIRYLIYSINI